MKTYPVVVGIVEYGEKVLFLKRVKEPFKGSLILPGGKAKRDETLEDAIEREIFEETGLNVKRKERVGFYEELVWEKGELTHRHELSIYLISSNSFEYRGSEEGEVVVIEKQNLPRMKEEINPSDYRILERVLFENQRDFRARIVVEKVGSLYRIISEEEI